MFDNNCSFLNQKKVGSGLPRAEHDKRILSPSTIVALDGPSTISGVTEQQKENFYQACKQTIMVPVQ